CHCFNQSQRSSLISRGQSNNIKCRIEVFRVAPATCENNALVQTQRLAQRFDLCSQLTITNHHKLDACRWVFGGLVRKTFNCVEEQFVVLYLSQPADYSHQHLIWFNAEFCSEESPPL